MKAKIRNKFIIITVTLFILVTLLLLFQLKADGSLRVEVSFTDGFKKTILVNEKEITLLGDGNTDNCSLQGGAKINMGYGMGNLIIPCRIKMNNQKICLNCSYIKTNNWHRSEWTLVVDAKVRGNKIIVIAKADGKEMPLIGNSFNDKKRTVINSNKYGKYNISRLGEL